MYRFDPPGFRDLYEAYATPLRRFVRRLAADRDLPESAVDTEGVVHDTFVVLLSGSRQPIRNPAAWLFTVARNQVRKAAVAQRRIAPGDAADHVHDGGTAWATIASPPADAENVRAAREVMHAIAGLPDHQRIATYLRQVEGWSLAEIGEYLDCAAATAGVHIHRGTAKVRDSFAPRSAPSPSPTATRRDSAAPGLLAALAALGTGLVLVLGAPWWLAAILAVAAAVLAIAAARVRR